MWKHRRRPPAGRETSPWTPPIVAILIFIALIGLTGVLLVRRGWLDGPGYVELIGGGAFTSLGALTAAMLLYWRWSVDHKTKVTHHREQERNKRQEKMGERMAQAVTHLGQGQGFMQVSGLIELAGLVDDWWSIGNEMLREIPESDGVEREAARAMIQLRRQEIIDLMFKHTLQPDAVGQDEKGGSAERQRRAMVQDARSQILVAHLPAPDKTGNVQEESWAQLDLSHAHLVNVQLRSAHLRGIDLPESNLTKADLSRADLTGADLKRAILAETELPEANLTKSDLMSAKLSKANLWNANLTKAYLLGTDLAGADLRKADLTGTSFFWSNLSDAKLDGYYKGSPKYTDETIFPSGYEPQSAGFKRVGKPIFDIKP